MYFLFLLLGLAAVVLSPLALDLLLTTRENGAPYRLHRAAKAKGPGVAWAPNHSSVR